jgi:hypothetical protein
MRAAVPTLLRSRVCRFPLPSLPVPTLSLRRYTHGCPWPYDLPQGKCALTIDISRPLPGAIKHQLETHASSCR